MMFCPIECLISAKNLLALFEMSALIIFYTFGKDILFLVFQ